MVQLSYPYMTPGKKNIALTIWTFVNKVMSLLSNMLFRFVIIFLPRTKCLNFMAAVILEPKRIKPVTFFIVFSSICHEVKITVACLKSGEIIKKKKKKEQN